MASLKTGKERKQAQRRTLRYSTLEDLSRDLDSIEAGHRAGTLDTTGNWTPGENLHHCSRFWGYAIDGFPDEMRPPWLVKKMAQVLFKSKAVQGHPAPPGFSLPVKVQPLLGPREGISFEEGMAAMRAQVARTKSGERFDKPSPLFGEMTHDEWLNLQLGHCSMHLSFLHPEGV